MQNSVTDNRQTSSVRWKQILKIMLPLIVLAASAAAAYHISKTGPRAGRKAPEKPLAIVEVIPLESGSQHVVVPAMGTVIPATEINLRPRVSGQIVRIHSEFVQGGLMKAGDEIVEIDAEDYRLAVEQAKNQVANARYALKLEMGQQAVAEREWQLVNGDKPADATDQELALRQPHLQKAKSDLAAAEATLKQAQLDLERTQILVPFNSMVLAKNVDLGSQVSTQDELAQLVGIDEFRVQVSIPVDRLKWIAIPRKSGEPGATARVFVTGDSASATYRSGQVIRLLGDLETEGRMARLLVSVKDPLNLNASANPDTPPLLIGQYVRVEIDGRRIDPVFSIPRSALREDSTVWIAVGDETLHIRPVNVIWRDESTVLITDSLKEGEHLIVSDLSSPVEGMKIRVAGS